LKDIFFTEQPRHVFFLLNDNKEDNSKINLKSKVITKFSIPCSKLNAILHISNTKLFVTVILHWKKRHQVIKYNN